MLRGKDAMKWLFLNSGWKAGKCSAASTGTPQLGNEKQNRPRRVITEIKDWVAFIFWFILEEFPGGLSQKPANYHFCILGLSTWSQHSRSQHRRTSCSRDEDRKPSEVFLEFHLHFVTSVKVPVHTIYAYMLSGNGSFFSELHFFYFSFPPTFWLAHISPPSPRPPLSPCPWRLESSAVGTATASTSFCLWILL